jgi:vacuolar-type H+-ATPase subunit B/Vma2
MERTGLYMGCHKEMSNAELWAKVATPGQLNDAQHMELMNAMFKAYAEKKDAK